ncbi:MAG TPA: hypothetical protein VGM60_13095 [Pseudonocardia sp.]|jgi:hypothetical protein|uniref:hypothetical protein n=1 Tax=Pseudonocardia sp. TaxID=60912 RepID=UPI002F41660C
MTDRAVRILVAAAEFVGLPSLWVVLRHEHVPNEEGHCLGCRPTEDVHRDWPCRTRQFADRAWSVHIHRGE